MNFKINWDGLGVATSIACAIHCAVLPLVISSLPLFGVNIIHNMVFEWGMIALAFAVGIYSLFHGFNRHHRSYVPVFLFSAGFVFLVSKQVFHAYEFFFLVPAVVLIVTAHYKNYRLGSKQKTGGTAHSH